MSVSLIRLCIPRKQGFLSYTPVCPSPFPLLCLVICFPSAGHSVGTYVWLGGVGELNKGSDDFLPRVYLTHTTPTKCLFNSNYTHSAAMKLEEKTSEKGKEAGKKGSEVLIIINKLSCTRNFVMHIVVSFYQYLKKQLF